MRCLFVLLSFLSLLGCATQQEMVWVRRDSTQEDFYTEDGQCKAQALGVSNPTLMQITLIHNNCMYGKGWRLVPKQ